MPLLIVESPNKIAKISKALPSDFVFMSSFGHIMDLDKKDMGIDFSNFEPNYKVSDDKKDVVKAIKEEAKKHDIIYVATDFDREGEGIGHNLLSILPKNKTIYRVAFTDLSKSEIQKAIKNPVGFNYNWFAAQQARRMTDRIVGFKVSPVMWAKGLRNTSAGRVQSATLKWLVDREKEIRSFKPEEYWTIHADMSLGFSADFYGINGKKYIPPNKAKTDEIINDLGREFEVIKYDATSNSRSPNPPFITSTLQKEAGTRFGWSSKKTMDVAQKLFENALITYHRTDSVRVELSKIKDVRDRIEKQFGKNYLSPKEIIYKTKDAAQDAHEAIRPTFEPIPTTISVDERKLLELITNRFMASQMADAQFDKTNVELEYKGKKNYSFRASGSILKFDGFLKVYGSSNKDTILPVMNVGDKLKIRDIKSVQHETKPPSRYTEPTFVSRMEKEGVGRPSTYASVIETLLKHNYVVRDKKALKPTEIGIMVSDYLSEFFKDFSNAEFTAKLEAELDQIESGKIDKKDVMTKFCQALEQELQNAIQGDPGEIFKTDRDCPDCNDGSKMVRRTSKHGVFLNCSNYPTCGKVMNFDEDGNIIESNTETGLPCPVCNSKLRKRQNTKTKEYFFSCSAYPVCNWTGNIDEDGNIIEKSKSKRESLGEKCPNCSDGELLKRKGPYSFFAGCSNYPKCKTSFKLAEDGTIIKTEGTASKAKGKSSGRDTGKKCPKCKSGTLIERDGQWGLWYACSGYPKCKHKEKGK